MATIRNFLDLTTGHLEGIDPAEREIRTDKAGDEYIVLEL